MIRKKKQPQYNSYTFYSAITVYYFIIKSNENELSISLLKRHRF